MIRKKGIFHILVPGLICFPSSHSFFRAQSTIIDVGMDTAHPDLFGHLWTNTNEIPGKGIDDGHNGYIDDVRGWNFIGGVDGGDMTVDRCESYREYRHTAPMSRELLPLSVATVWVWMESAMKY